MDINPPVSRLEFLFHVTGAQPYGLERWTSSCYPLYYIVIQKANDMQTTLTVRLTEKEAKELQAICKLSGKTRSEVVREALRGKLIRERLDAMRAVAIPRAREIGWLTEDDIFREVS